MNTADPEKNMMDDDDSAVESNEVAETAPAEDVGVESETNESTIVNDSRAKTVEALQAELAQAKDHMLRVLADAENTKKRALRERDDAVKYAVSAFARDLLDFSDNFVRAIESFPATLCEEDERIGKVVSGIEAMNKELLATFEKHGIKRLEPVDQAFDPNFHEVMFEAPAPDKAPGTVIQVIEPGYTLHGRLLRPARVGVARDDGQGSGKNSAPGSRIDHEV